MRKLTSWILVWAALACCCFLAADLAGRHALTRQTAAQRSMNADDGGVTYFYPAHTAGPPGRALARAARDRWRSART